MFKQFKKEYKQVLKNIKKYQKIIVFRHQRPDYDALGTQLGLVTWIKDNFPSKEVHYVGKNHSTFMPYLYPYMEELQDNVFEGEFLAIVVDTGNSSRIDDERYKKGSTIIKFDHHPNIEPYGNINIVYNELSSCAELVSDFLFSCGNKYPLSRLAAKYLYSGIVGDTGRFLFSSVNATTMRNAARLMDVGIVPARDVFDAMYEKDLASIELQKFVLNQFKVTKKGVAYYVLEDKDLKSLGIDSERGKEYLSIMSGIRGVPIWFSVTEEVERGTYRVSIRSKILDISSVASKWRGGGHINASGATLNTLEELPLLIKDLEELIK